MGNTKLQAALIAGPVFGVLANVPYVDIANVACCALYIGGGVLAGYLFFKGRGPLDNAYAEGAVAGLLAGVFGGVVSGVLGVVLQLLGVGASETADALARMDDEGYEIPQFVYDVMGLSPLTTSTAILGVVRATVLYSVFGTVGGLLGAAFFRNKGEDG